MKIINKGAMKITGDTRIKDILTDEYEVDNVDAKGGVLIIGYHKKEVKDFNWYKEEYLKKSEHYRQSDPTYKGKILFLFSIGDEFYKSLPFEIRIGLLKFICDDLNANMFNVISAHRSSLVNTLGLGQDKIFAICPKEFLNSLIE